MVLASPKQASERGTPHQNVAGRIADQVETVIAGKREVIELSLVALLARGHLLIEDVPGVGKTTLARAIAKSVGVDFRRLQFTSDLMPTDVLGGNVLDPKHGTFTFRPGPVFTNVLLADEINRTTPRTQSSLLEAMAERQTSIDGETHALPRPFFVIATQNPRDFYGTYPLPESQLDRFLLRLRIGYPDPRVEREVLGARQEEDPVASLAPVVTQDELVAAQAQLDDVSIESSVVDYLHAIVLATRNSTLLEIGASTRAALAFERACRAAALVDGRSYVLPDDVKRLAVPVLAHRLRVSGSEQGAGSRRDAERIVSDLVESLSVPV